MIIRPAITQDKTTINKVYIDAFTGEEGETVSKLATDLLFEQTSPSILSLIAEIEGDVVGHIGFSPVKCIHDSKFQGYILAPLAVKTALQKKGIGTALIKSGMQQIAAAKAEIIFVYGDPEYYGRFGFTTNAAAPYSAPYQLEFPFGWQAVYLHRRSILEATIPIACVASLQKPELW